MATPKKPEQIRFDPKRFAELVPPLMARLTRFRAGSTTPELINLPGDGANMQPDEVLGIEKHVHGKHGGGHFQLQVSDANNNTMEWQWLHPTTPIVSAEMRQENAAARQAAQAGDGAQPGWNGAAQSQPQGMPQPVNPWAPAQPQAPQSQSPFGFQPQQYQPQIGALPWQPQPPPWQAPSPYGMSTPGGPPYGMPNPWAQPQMPPWMQPPPWGQMPPWGLPPQVPVAAPDDARLRALEQQNNQLREDAVRRQANEATVQLSGRLDSLAQQTQAQFTQLLEKLGAGAPQAAASAESARLVQLEQQRRDDLARSEQQRRDDEFKRELLSVKEEARRSEEKFRSELAAQQAAGANQTMMQSILDRQAQQAQAHQASLTGLFERFAPLLMTPEKVLTIAKELVPGKDGISNRITEAAIDQMLNGRGGGGGMPEVVATLGSAVIDAGTKITQAVFDGKAAETTAKARAEAQQQQRLNQQAAAFQQRQAQEAHQRALADQQRQGALNGATNGHGNGAAQHGNGASQQSRPAAAIPIIPVEQRAPSENDTAEGLLDEDEQRYFGPVQPYIRKLRDAVAGGFLSPERVVDIVVTEYIRNVGDWEMKPPIMVDLEANPHRAVQRALPDATGPFRQKVIELLPDALKAAIADFNEAGAEAEAEAKAEEIAGSKPPAAA